MGIYRRAGATSRAMGMDMHQLNSVIGTVTAATKQSGNEVGNFVKNVLPRLVGKPAQAALDSLDISLTDSDGNLKDIIGVYTEVANKVKGISDSERIAVTEGLAGKFHISRMQALLDDLGSVDSMYRRMEETSKTAAGSAMTENEEYMKSLQARMGLARVEVEKLALSIGEAFLTEGMIQGIKMFADVLEAISSVVKVVGFLPAGFALAGLALTLLSTKFKGLTVAISQSILGMMGFRTATTSTGAASATLGARLIGLGASMKTFIMSTGLAGVAFVAVGFAIEKVMGLMGTQREAQEAIERNNRELASSYKENGKEINLLASRYETLQDIMRTGTEKEKTEVADEYLAVQNKLAELMPNLSTGEDEYGNAVLGNATILENRIKLIERQIEAEEKLQATKDLEKEEKVVKELEDNLKVSDVGKDYQLKQFNNRNTGIYGVNEHLIDMHDIEVKSYEDMLEVIKRYEEESAKYAVSGDATREKYANKRVATLQKIADEYIQFNDKYSAEEANLATKSFESTEKIINDNNKLSDSTKDMATTIASTVATLGIETEALGNIFSGITDGLDDSGKLGTFIDDYTTAFSRLEKAQKDGLSTKELDNYLKTAQSSFGLVRDEVLQTARDNGVLENSVEYADLEARLISYGNANLVSAEFVSKLALSTGQSTEQIRAQILATSDGTMMMEDFEDATEGVVAKQYELKDAIDQMSGVAQQQIDDTETMTWQYDMLTAQLETLAVGTDAYNEVNDRLIGVKEQLLALYPHLFAADQTAEKLTYKQIEAIKQEVEANDILRAAYKASRDGKLTADEDRAISGIETAKVEIHNINEQIKALNRLAAAYRAFSEKSLALAQELKDAGGLDSEAEDAFIQAQKWKGFADKTDANNAGALATYKAELAGVTKTQKGFIDTLKDSEAVMGNTTTSANKLASEKQKAAKSTDKADKAQKDYNETLKESIYLANTFKEALEKLNLEESRLNAIKAKYPSHSKEYRDALQKELAVLYEKKALNQEEAKHINAQLKSGNVAKTGIVTKGSGGSYTGKYAKEVNAASAKHGIDAQLIAAVIAAESNFNPNAKSSSGARGLMQLMPSTAKGLGVKDSYNAEQNIMGGAKYLAQQLKAFGGDIQLALAAYNAGPGNVKKHGGVPPFKETQNYVKKITDALAKTSVSVAKSAGQSVADYYAGSGFNVTSGFGKRTAPKSGASTDHQGVDLAAKAGTSIKSLRSGKVIASYYHTTGGNMVSIQQDDGTVAKYMHMQNASNVKKGQSVKAGQEIGKVGTTGNSTGNHLHLEIVKDNKAVDPLPYLKAQGQAISDASQAIAENLQDLDSLGSDLNAKEQQNYAYNEQIRTAQRAIIESDMAVYTKRHKVLQGFLDEEIAKKDSLDLSSTRYQNSLKRSIKYMGLQGEEYKKEIADTEKLIKYGKLDVKVKEEMIEKAELLRLALVGLNSEMANFSVERIDASQRVFNENLADMSYEIEKSQAIMGLYEEGTIEYNKEFASQIEGMKKKQEEGVAARESLQRSLLLHDDLTPEKIKEYKQDIQQLTLEYWNLESAINSSSKELVESEKKMSTDLADKLIDSLKSYIDETKTMKLRALDEEMKVEDKRHKKVTDNLKKEMDIYRDLIQTKLDSIDKEESETDYNKEMDVLGADKTRIQGELNLLSMDDSYEAKSQRKKLQEELTVLDETILDKRHKREVDLRKENLQEMLTVKEEAIAKEEEAEQLIHDNAKDRIDDLKTYWDQFYTDQLNDERRFAQLREDVMKGNFDNISAEFKGYLTEMEETMPSLENTMDGTMQAVGTSIRQNIIDALKEAVDLMGQVSGGGVASVSPSHQGSAGAPPSGGSSGTSGGSGKSLSGGDLSVLGGKFLADKLRSQETNNSRRETITDRARSMASDGRSQGSTIAENKGFDELVQGLSAEEKKQLAGYLSSRVQGMFSTPNLKDFIEKQIQILNASGMGFKTGGFTGKGGLGLLHEEEFVLNKGQTKEAMKMADLFSNLNRMMSVITMPKQPTLAGATTGDSYEFNFAVDKLNANEKEVNTFSKQIQDRLKRNKGVR